MKNHIKDPFDPISSAEIPSEAQGESFNELLPKLEALLSGPASDLRMELLREMIAGVVKYHEQRLDVLDIKIVNRTLKELRHAFKVFQPYEHCLKVSIYGSARTSPDDPDFQLAERFGRLLSQRGFMVITGAGPGIMDAGHRGAGRDMSFGVNIMLPFEQSANATIAEDPKLVYLKYFFTRKLLFVRESQAAAFFSGGFGTMDEAFEILTLLQTGKSDLVPVVCLQAPGSDYWDRWLDFVAGQLLPRGLISESDLSLFKVFQHEEPAVQEIQNFYRNFHSSRFVGQQMVIRMRMPLTPHQLAEVQSTFQDLCTEGSFTQVEAFPQEQSEPRISHLPRLAFNYHRRNAGRLRQLVDWLNGLPQEPHSSRPLN
ncbi:LOG family protein [Candidatus Nitronereus thalassa]|uniref:AMP nucleosidase n=1 Tax=Candidatus Nitronereus thalassa TaxID=3020898 RepID=A0ABU3K9K7_9BACT|nr:LOG family protein [Candidatus Nitronereus thalassa]MDT7043100.1 LOG family protein [Candidatus Nitronereus thalassa]